MTVDFTDECWRRTQPLSIYRRWNGDHAPDQLKTTARVVWSKAEIGFGFECSYAELDMDDQFDVAEERYALWDRDVCEAFVRSPLEPHEKHYREFEVAPTGQWCDLIIDRSMMTADWQWRSGMRTAAEIDRIKQIWRVAMLIPFEAFDCTPSTGDIWQANLFRISRVSGEREYLTLSPTLGEKPNFHVPDRFVNLCFQP